MSHALWITWLLGVMISPSKEGPLAQAPLSCDPAGVCDGRSRSLSSIPSGLPASVKRLDLSNNKITAVGHSDLQSCVNLKALVLRSSGIHTIEEEAFLSLGSLEYLDLSENRLSNLSSSWFRHLPTLKFLNLLGNSYQTLGETPLFSHLTSLRVLRIGNDHFTRMQKTDFAGLSFLDELQIEAPNLQNYKAQSLKSIQRIGHLVLRMRRHDSLLEIFADVLGSVEHLELGDTNLNTFSCSELPIGDTNPLITKFTFRNVHMTDKSFRDVLKFASYASELLELEFEDCTYNGIGDFQGSEIQEAYPKKGETLTIRRVHIPNFYLFYDLSSIYSLMGRVKRITLENSKVFLVPCLLSQHLKSLEYLDLSENLMVEENLGNAACEGGWPSLQTLILRKNHFVEIGKVGAVLLTLHNLTRLDISRNGFHSMPEICQWPEKMRYLNLSSTQIDKLTNCIPQTLEILDVSYNNLNSLSLPLPQLKELYISGNKLKTLPDGSRLPTLQVLKISRNVISAFSQEELDTFPSLKTLEAGGNNFICSCDFVTFAQAQPTLDQVLSDWPARYLCDSPAHVRGQRVQDARLSVAECHRAALVSVVCCALVLLLLLLAVLCHRLHGLWYLRMIWAWLHAKRKPRRAPRGDICYDAFVSYSERDSYWVEELLVQELEHAEPPFRLCLHKRDFVPGKWIIDNIIDCIEKSHKTVFVLSENFVKSEWCKYELDFSHFRLFDENNDAAILVLLEPIEKKAIPQRFCKLRKVMNTRTYLEWPAEEAQRQGFWDNLRAAIKA
ncbi:toll-like receptor 2 [Cavia porcellus]|uniref:Toll-like receptor 2 n=1 Tax=Cavia porcellus TaxID=10141 RepID=H0WAE9_CAVPO|nr:toll-like receptor 2 [Cavia porcellus]XP_012996237.1 toll-like receptor 2 [Cavia porcellus]